MPPGTFRASWICRDARGGEIVSSASMTFSRSLQSRLQKQTTVRRLTRCDVKQSGAQFTFIIEGDGFLYKMCRGIVGTIVQAGLGKFPPDEIKTMLAKADRRVAGMTAPAHGLVLWKVFYKHQRSGKRAGMAKCLPNPS